jgi:hypothetical protein
MHATVRGLVPEEELREERKNGLVREKCVESGD